MTCSWTFCVRPCSSATRRPSLLLLLSSQVGRQAGGKANLNDEPDAATDRTKQEEVVRLPKDHNALNSGRAVGWDSVLASRVHLGESLPEEFQGLELSYWDQHNV